MIFNILLQTILHHSYRYSTRPASIPNDRVYSPAGGELGPSSTYAAAAGRMWEGTTYNILIWAMDHVESILRGNSIDAIMYWLVSAVAARFIPCCHRRRSVPIGRRWNLGWVLKLPLFLCCFFFFVGSYTHAHTSQHILRPTRRDEDDDFGGLFGASILLLFRGWLMPRNDKRMSRWCGA